MNNSFGCELRSFDIIFYRSPLVDRRRGGGGARWIPLPRGGHSIDKEEKLSGRVTGPKQLISFSPTPLPSPSPAPQATWIEWRKRTWCRYTAVNFLLLSGPISTDFHNGSTYECTHLSPIPYPLSPRSTPSRRPGPFHPHRPNLVCPFSPSARGNSGNSGDR